MSTTQTKSHTLDRLAKRLEEDIQHRRLDAGDPYLSTVAAAKMLGVSTTTAHRALKLLAEKEVLVRKPQLGTFVGCTSATKRSDRIRSVYVLVPSGEHDMKDPTFDAGLMLTGIPPQIHDCAVQFAFLPKYDSIRYVKRLVGSIKESGEAAGLVPVSCPRGIYSAVASAGLPVVVVGTLYLGDPEILSIDTDNREAGRMLVQYLIDQGHSRIAMLRGHGHLPGDDDFQDGVSHVLTAAGLPPNAITIRSLPYDPKAFLAATQHLLKQDDPPTGFITRVQPFAKIIGSAASGLGFDVPKDVQVVSQEPLTIEAEESPYPTVRSRWCVKDVAKRITMMLETPSPS